MDIDDSIRAGILCESDLPKRCEGRNFRKNHKNRTETLVNDCIL